MRDLTNDEIIAVIAIMNLKTSAFHKCNHHHPSDKSSSEVLLHPNTASCESVNVEATKLLNNINAF